MKWPLAILGLLAVGMTFKLSLLVYAMYVLLGVLLVNRFLTRLWTENAHVTRYCSQEVFEIGEWTQIDVEVENKGPTSIPWLILEDSLPRAALTQVPPRIKAEGSRLTVTRLAAGGRTSLTYRVLFLLRGYYQLGPSLLETGDVFGLHRRFRVTSDPAFALVLPRVLPLRGYNLASRRPVGEIRLAHRLFEDPTRIAGTRIYQPGDPLNRVHWRATARTGQLHSRVFESSCVAGAMFLLDFHQQSYQGSGAAVAAELAITTVSSLANAIYLMGQQIGLVSNGRDAADRIREEGWRAEFTTRAEAQKEARALGQNERLRPLVVGAGKGAAQFARILEVLARLEQTEGLGFSQMVEEAVHRMPRDATVVAVLGRVSSPTAVALGGLVRRGMRVNAIVSSFDLETPRDWAQPPEWAAMLLEEGIEFKVVQSEESITELCAGSVAG
jgi:uncharacterized protein (DUF58 family)